MERIRYLAGGLLVLTGVVQVLQLFAGPLNIGALITVLFGVAYLMTGVLLLTTPRRIWYITGIVVPLLGILIAVLGTLSAQATTLLLLFYIVVSVVVVVLCIYLATGKK